MDYAVYLLPPLCFALGYAGRAVKSALLGQRVYSLECEVSDLQNKLLIEIKRRAGGELHKGKQLDKDILEAAKLAPGGDKVPWYMQYVGKV